MTHLKLAVTHFFDRAQAKAQIKPLAIGLCMALFAFLLSRISVMGLLTPFGFAAFAASEQAKRNQYWSLGGTLLGCLSLYPDIPYHIILACTLYLGLSLLTRIKSIDIPRIRLPLLSGAAFTLSALLLRNAVAYDLIASLVEGALVIVGGLIIYTAVDTLSRKRTLLSEEESICLAICLSLCIAGFQPLQLYFFTPAYGMSTLLLLVFGFLGGAGVGAAAGISLGVILSMCGGAPLMMSVCLGACGLLCGLAGKIGRIGCIAGALVANALLTLTINSRTAQILPFTDMLLASAVFLLLPRKFLNRLGELLSRTLGRRKKENEYSADIRGAAIQKLQALAVTFDEMGNVFSDLEYSPFEMEESVRRIAQTACMSCTKLKSCWEDNLPETYGCVQNMCVELMNGGQASLKGNLVNNCLHASNLEQSAQGYADELSRLHGGTMRNGGKLFAEQLSGISHVVEGLAKDLSVEVRFDGRMERGVLEALDAMGIRGARVRVIQESGSPLRVSVTLPYGKKQCVCEKGLLRAVQLTAQVPLKLTRRRCPKKSNGRKCQLVYQQSAALQVQSGAAQNSAPGNSVCGDSYAYENIGKNKYILCLSDGMGNGPLAAGESRATISLLLNFYKTGYRRETILNSLNALMLLHNQPQEMFSTVDICHIDLLKSEAEIVKIGAAPSLLLRGGAIHAFTSRSLPIGILEDVAPDVYAQQLCDGDYIVLLSDGVSGAFADEDALKNAVREARTQTPQPQEMAETILQSAAKEPGEHTPDDMTVLVARIQKS